MIFDGQKTKESKRQTFVLSRKKIRYLILSEKNETRYSKIDQGSIFHLKAQWKDYGDILFQPFRKDSADHVGYTLALRVYFFSDIIDKK